MEILEELVEKDSDKMDVRDKDQVVSRMRAAVASKQFGQEDILCSLVADVIITFYPCLNVSLVLLGCADLMCKAFSPHFIRPAFKFAPRTLLTSMWTMFVLQSSWVEV